jgi:hypothetical protein
VPRERRGMEEVCGAVLDGRRASCCDAGGPASEASRGPALSTFGARGRTDASCSTVNVVGALTPAPHGPPLDGGALQGHHVLHRTPPWRTNTPVTPARRRTLLRVDRRPKIRFLALCQRPHTSTFTHFQVAPSEHGLEIVPQHSAASHTSTVLNCLLCCSLFCAFLLVLSRALYSSCIIGHT